MKMLQKLFALLVVVAVFLPIIAFAAPYASLASGKYTLAASSGGNPLNFGTDGTLNLSGLDSSAKVQLSVTRATGGGQTGLNIVGPRDSITGLKPVLQGSGELTAGQLQSGQVEVQVAGESPIPVKASGANTTSNNPPFLNNNPANNSSSAPDTSTAQSNSDNPSSGNSGGGGGGSGIVLVPCDGSKGKECTIEKLKTMGANIFNYLAGFGAILAVGAIVMAGFSYIKSGGDPSAMKDAKQKIILAITGLIILGASVLIVNTVLKVLGSDQKVEDIQAK
ncbi:MAG: pilin [bacterium]|nr:pilin [bacterium]